MNGDVDSEEDEEDEDEEDDGLWPIGSLLCSVKEGFVLFFSSGTKTSCLVVCLQMKSRLRLKARRGRGIQKMRMKKMMIRGLLEFMTLYLFVNPHHPPLAPDPQ